MLNSDSDQTDPGASGPGATSTPWTPEELAQAQAWANDYYTSHKIPSTYGTASDLLSQYQQQRSQGKSHQDAMTAAPVTLGWDKYTPESGPTGPVTPPPTSGPGNQTPPDIMNAPLTKPYGGTFTPPPGIDLGGPNGINFIPGTPNFTGANAPPQFAPPSVADALNEPGYKFRVGQGEDALQNWAAARGTLNDSSTAKSLEDYGQNAASQEYANVFDRGLNTFATKYKGWQDSILGPTMAGYATQAAAGQGQNALNYQNAWQQFLNGQGQFNNWQDRTWNKILGAATA